MKQVKEQTIESYFDDLIYNEEAHSYLVNGRKLTNTTTFVNSFKRPFETYQISSFVASAAAKKGRPSDPAYYRRMWALRGKIAADRGTSTHLFMQQAPLFDTPDTMTEKAGLDWYYDCIDQQQEIVAKELKMYCGALGGTLDMLTKQGDTYYLYDFKTNSDLNKSYNKMLRQYSAFDDSPLNLYSMQQAIYMWMLKEMCDIEVKVAKLVHLKEDGSYEEVELNQDIVDLTTSLLNIKKDEQE